MEPQILPPQPTPRARGKKRVLLLAAIASGILLGLAGYFLWPDKAPQTTKLESPGGKTEPPRAPILKNQDVVIGYSNIWDMVFVDDQTIVFDERSGKLHGAKLDGSEKWEIGTVPNVRAEGEGGLLGLALDTDFKNNRTMYACYNATDSKRTVRVTKFTLSEDFKSANGFTDIITDIESQAGRHSGCRMQMDQNGHLWIGTGDSAIGSAPQNPKSLAGKVLRVDREGKGVSGNATAPFDNRIYNYGHRNIQGIALLKAPLSNGAIGITSEHGPDKQDEVNWLMPGNFGWNPAGSRNAYDESVPMTDKTRYPDAVEAIWHSGDKTIAVSGIAFLTSERWSLWRGWVAVAALNGKQVRLLEIKGNGLVATDESILTEFGRLRTVVEGPGGDLYLATDNGNGSDKIIRVIPE